jgi:hypothetical protein
MYKGLAIGAWTHAHLILKIIFQRYVMVALERPYQVIFKILFK